MLTSAEHPANPTKKAFHFGKAKGL